MRLIRKILVLGIALLLLAYFLPLSKPAQLSTPAYNPSDLKFPSGFFWGSSTAAHQVEGNNNNHLTQWEKDNAQRLASEAEAKLKNSVPNWDLIKADATDPDNYISGLAVDEYNRYPEDITLMKQMGHNAYRFSIEWSRIEPVKDQFDEAQLNHYQEEIKALKAAGIEPFVTIWHRSQPIWLAKPGEWENPETIQEYKDYVEYLAKNLGPEVKYWMTFNEPVFHVLSAYVQGELPPQVKSLKRGNAVLDNMMRAHREAYAILHQFDEDAEVGSTQAMQLISGAPNSVANKILAGYLEDYANWRFLDGTTEQTDFVGLQYYGPTVVKIKFGGNSIVSVENPPNTEAKLRSDSGTEIYPDGIYELIRQTWDRYHKPIIITENGIADSEDRLRGQYIQDHLYWIHRAVDEKIPVLGYFYWSLLDNFEWSSGFWPKFGLIHVDFDNNLKRTIRPSAEVYKKIIENK
jgi:beta-glucosidase